MSKLVALLALACLVLTALWVGLLIADMATAGLLETFEQVAAHASRLHGLFYATYLNTALLTLAVVAFFAALHAWLRPTAPDWALNPHHRLARRRAASPTSPCARCNRRRCASEPPNWAPPSAASQTG